MKRTRETIVKVRQLYRAWEQLQRSINAIPEHAKNTMLREDVAAMDNAVKCIKLDDVA